MASKLPLHFLVVLAVVSACTRGPDVETDTPEETAESVGRILCAEHELRIDAILASFEDAQAVQEAKAEVLVDALGARDANERLRAFADLLDDEEDTLRTCEVVLEDLDVVEKDTKVMIALHVRVGDWEITEDGTPRVTTRDYPMLLTLTHLRDAWRVTESHPDIARPGGALDSLLD